METTQKRGRRRKEREGERGIRRIAFRLCSIKGEITHLLRFFLKTTALIDQTAWMYQPIFNMKYRHQKSITPVFSLSLCSSLSLVLAEVDASTSLSPLCVYPRVSRPSRLWISHRLCLTCTLCYLPVHVLDKWRSRSYSIII